MKRVVLILLILLVVPVGITLWEYQQNSAIGMIQAKDRTLKLDTSIDAVLYALEHGEQYNGLVFDDVYVHTSRRFDTSDFRLQSLARILYRHRDSLTEAELQVVSNTFLEMKYWMDQPGQDAMCFWSENHQILFAASEYLAGQFWPDEVFSNSGLNGREHQAMARARILTWLEQRWLYGFTEWYSNTYYVEDIAPLANLIDFAKDDEIVVKAQIILDLLLYDLATQSWRGSFISSSGRMYGNGKRYPEKNSMQAVVDSIWDPARWGREPSQRKGMDLNFILIENYVVPPVIKAIGEDDQREVVIKASSGLDLVELAGEGLIGLEDRQIMMQWGMEAFSNDLVIENTLDYMRQNNMFGSEFLHDFKHFNFSLLRKSGAMPALSRALNPVTNGVAIQRANTYTYKTPDYMVASAQAYHPGTYGDQQHIWNALLGGGVSVFVTHPAKSLSDEGALAGSPGYWVGNGRIPHSAQDRNVVLNIFRIPGEPGFMEKAVQDFTHAHFPQDRFDEVMVQGRYAFGRTGDTYAAFIARYPLYFQQGSSDDLIQPGRDGYWIFEAGSRDADTDFERFRQRILSNEVEFDGATLRYHSAGRELSLVYEGKFQIDGQTKDLSYPRFASPYAVAPRKPDTINIAHAGKTLHLDFYGHRRDLGQTGEPR
jgi:hypothetical protein